MFFKNYKGVSEVTSYIFIVLIVIVIAAIIITGVYPSIQKSISKVNFDSSVEYIEEIKDNTNLVLENPIGSTTSVSLNLSDLFLEIDSINQTIEIYHNMSGDYYQEGILIEEGNIYTYKEFQKLAVGLNLNDVNFIGDVVVTGSKINLYIRKIEENKVLYSTSLDTTYDFYTENERDRPIRDYNYPEDPDPTTYTLFLDKNISSAGTVSGEGNYSAGESVTAVATANPGYTFVNWTDVNDSVVSSNTSYTFVMPENDLTLTANYFTSLYVLNVSKTGTGSGIVISDVGDLNCGTTCSDIYDYNTLVTLTATPDSGSDFDGWSGACSGTSTTCEVTMDEAKTVTANFISYSNYTLTLDKNYDNGGSVSGAGDYLEDSLVTVTTTENSYYTFTGWERSGYIVSTDLSYTFNMPSNNLTLTANYLYDPGTFETSFKSTWDTRNTSTDSSASNQIKLPLYNAGDYDFLIDWGDGNTDHITSNSQVEVTHTYDVSGIYDIQIIGLLNGFRFNNTGDKLKLLDISEWGDLKLGSIGHQFYGAENLEITATDFLDLSRLTSFYGTFRDCSSIITVPNITLWDTSRIGNMAFMFADASSFNQDLSSLDTSNVGNFGYMFSGASSFNQDLSLWDTSEVDVMAYMFSGASSFNQPLNDWNVSSVTDMSYMFEYASDFNQPLNDWNISNVTNMNLMFYYASSFNQPLNDWNVSNVNDMESIFYGSNFNQPLNNWDVSNVTDMYKLFGNCPFNQSLDSWDLSSVTRISSMFLLNSDFNQPLNDWNVSNVSLMQSVFSSASSFNQPLNNWDTSNVENMYAMFSSASSFNQDISMWDTSNVTHMGSMFSSASSFNQPLNSWNVSNVDSMQYMFYNSSFNQPLDNWNLSNVERMNDMFSNNTDFNQDISSWDVSSVQYMSNVFNGATSFNQPLNDWNVSSVTDMDHMFSEASSFNQPLNNWDVSSVTNMNHMFYKVYNFNQSLNDWDVSNVSDMQYLFSNTNFNQSLNNWDVSSVTTMSGMFSSSLFDQNLANWDISNVEYMGWMFYNSDLSTANYDALLNGWSIQSVQPNVSLDLGTIQYSSTGESARDILTGSPNNWSISDGGLAS